jgi:hypothetical protein
MSLSLHHLRGENSSWRVLTPQAGADNDGVCAQSDAAIFPDFLLRINTIQENVNCLKTGLLYARNSLSDVTITVLLPNTAK